MHFFMQAVTESKLCRRKYVEEIRGGTEKNDVCVKLPTHRKRGQQVDGSVQHSSQTDVIIW